MLSYVTNHKLCKNLRLETCFVLFIKFQFSRMQTLPTTQLLYSSRCLIYRIFEEIPADFAEKFKQLQTVINFTYQPTAARNYSHSRKEPSIDKKTMGNFSKFFSTVKPAISIQGSHVLSSYFSGSLEPKYSANEPILMGHLS